MIANDRKQRILKHLALTGAPNLKRRFPSSQAEASPTPITPPTMTLGNRKERIREHLASTNPNFSCFNPSVSQRQQQIQQHLRLSKG